MQCQAVVFAVLALCLHQGYALKCFECNSDTDAKCGDPIDRSLEVTDCPPKIVNEMLGLVKNFNNIGRFLGKLGDNFTIPTAPEADAVFTCGKATNQDNDKKVIVRFCSVPKNEEFDMCTKVKERAAGFTFCETCESDACNTAAGVIPSALLMMCAAGLMLFQQ